MFESSYPPETEADEVVSSGTIGQALDRIVSDAPRAPVLNKKLVFPRESVRVSELEEKQRKAREEEEKQAKLAKEKEEKARLEAEKVAKAQQVREFKDLDLPFEDEEPVEQVAAIQKPEPAVEKVVEAKEERVLSQPVTPVPKTKEVAVPKSQPPQAVKKPLVKAVEPVPEPKAEEKPVVEEEVIPEREVVAYRRVIPSRRRVVREVGIPEKLEVEKDAAVSEADLELYMRETENVETRQVICRQATMELIEEIAEQTGCAPEDLASQAVESVALAIQEAGFQFDLPMSVKCVREGK